MTDDLIDMAFVKVAELPEMKEGHGKIINVNGRTIALFLVNGAVHAIDNSCPHRGGPLGEGIVDDNTVSCPWHGWKFDLISGKSPSLPAHVNVYNVKTEGNSILVDI